MGATDLLVFPTIAGLARKQGFRLCGGDEGAMKTDEVCDRPLDPFGSLLPELTLIAACENGSIRKMRNIFYHHEGGFMFTTYTYQDYLTAEDKIALLCKAIEKFKASAEFVRALSASSYFRGENPTIARKTILRARKIETRGTDGRRHVRAGTEDVVGNRIGSSFLFRFVTQQNQFLLSEGVSLPEETKKRLGADFDHLLSRLGECALLHGVSYGYWNADHLEIIEMARAAGSGFFPLLDEMTGELMLGV